MGMVGVGIVICVKLCEDGEYGASEGAVARG